MGRGRHTGTFRRVELLVQRRGLEDIGLEFMHSARQSRGKPVF